MDLNNLPFGTQQVSKEAQVFRVPAPTKAWEFFTAIKAMKQRLHQGEEALVIGRTCPWDHGPYF